MNCIEMVKNALKIFIMIGEKFENFAYFTSEMGKNTLKISTMFGENFENFASEMDKNALKISTVVGLWTLDISLLNMAKNVSVPQ